MKKYNRNILEVLAIITLLGLFFIVFMIAMAK